MTTRIIDTSKKTIRIIDTSLKPRKITASDVLKVLCELPQEREAKIIYKFNKKQ